jgi:hypothetical protein
MLAGRRLLHTTRGRRHASALDDGTCTGLVGAATNETQRGPRRAPLLDGCESRLYRCLSFPQCVLHRNPLLLRPGQPTRSRSTLPWCSAAAGCQGSLAGKHPRPPPGRRLSRVVVETAPPHRLLPARLLPARLLAAVPALHAPGSRAEPDPRPGQLQPERLETAPLRDRRHALAPQTSLETTLRS